MKVTYDGVCLSALNRDNSGAGANSVLLQQIPDVATHPHVSKADAAATGSSSTVHRLETDRVILFCFFFFVAILRVHTCSQTVGCQEWQAGTLTDAYSADVVSACVMNNLSDTSLRHGSGARLCALDMSCWTRSETFQALRTSIAECNSAECFRFWIMECSPRVADVHSSPIRGVGCA